MIIGAAGHVGNKWLPRKCCLTLSVADLIVFVTIKDITGMFLLRVLVVITLHYNDGY